MSHRLSIADLLRVATTALWRKKLRTGLTMLGVIIGIAAVIVITAIGRGVQTATAQQLQALGTNVILVEAIANHRPGIPQSNQDQSGGQPTTTLTWEDAQAIAQEVTVAQAVTAFLQQPQVQVVYQNETISTTLLGTDSFYPEVRNIHPQVGQFLSPDDLQAAKSVAVLGSKVRDRLFGSQEVIGESIRIQGNRYTVIGVMESKGAMGEIDQDDQVYIPLTNMSTRIVGNTALSGRAISGLWLKTRDEASLEIAQFQVTNLLRLRHAIYPPQPDDFRLTNQMTLLSTLTSVVSLMTLMVGAIASISLVVGGIGIANIMVVAVVERTREIGLRKAVGATNQAILSQFLTEAIMISGLGGSIGIGVGMTIAWGVALLGQFPFIVSFTSVSISFGLACIVGLLAGMIPAHHAARLDPILALRSE